MLTTLSQDLRAYSPQFDDQAVQDYVDDLLEEVNVLFEPFDVSVQYAQAASLSDIANTLQSTATSDAYIYVGGITPDTVPWDFGAAVQDIGNLEDNLAFVFTGELEFNVFGVRESIGANIARQAGISFGLATTENSVTATITDVMSAAGTDSNGDHTTTQINANKYYEFQRLGMPVSFVNGVSPGQQNSFAALEAVVGMNPAGVQYFTTSGDADNIRVEIIDANTIDFEINGQTFSNIDISKGMIIRSTQEAADTIAFSGAGVDVVVNRTEIAVNDNIQITERSFSFSQFTLQLGAAADQVLVNEPASTFTLNTGGGDDTISVATTETNFKFTRLESGGGNDRFVMLNNKYAIPFIDAGPGRDTLDHPGGGNVWLWDVNEDGFVFGFIDQISPDAEYAMYERFEDIAGPVDLRYSFSTCIDPRCTPAPVPVRDDFLTTIIDNDLMTITDQVTGSSLTQTAAEYAIGNDVFVLSTARDMTIDGSYVQISSDLDWQVGTLDPIQHSLVVVTTAVVSESEVLVSNRAGAGLLVEFAADTNKFTGLTGGTLQVESVRGDIVIHGSDSETDFFVLNSVDSGNPRLLDVTIYGHGGDDGFIFGSRLEDHAGDLDKLFRFPSNLASVIGGDGRDFVEINDEASTGAFVYEIDDTSVRDVTPASVADRRFMEILHQETEIVRVSSNSQKNVFQVDPAANVIFVIDGGDPGAGDGDSLDLINPSDTRFRIVREGQGNGAWYFGDQPDADQVVNFKGVEYVAESARLAIGSQAGSPSVVRVFNPVTREHLFDFNPYPAGFTGGVQVATGDLTGDSIPDIIVAPGQGRYGLVKVYDGRNGAIVSSFHAFPADQPNYFDNYTGGVDVAVANVTGDEAFEIIASTLRGNPDVRTFVPDSSGPDPYRVVWAFNPLPGAQSGVSIATGDFNDDGYADIISTPGPGWAPQVAVHSFGENLGVPERLHYFNGYVPGYLGGFNATTGDINADGVPEIILAGINTGSSADPFSGQYRVFDGANLPVDSLDPVTPIDIVQAFDRNPTRGVSVAALDADLDGVIDQVFAARRDAGGAGEIRVFDTSGNLLDSIFNSDGLFDIGIDLG